jgi:hypothetical protein
MQKYRVGCTNYTYEDSYMDGEVGPANCYDNFLEVKAENAIEAIRAYYEHYVPKTFDPTSADTEVFDNMFHDTYQFGSSGLTPTESEIEQWKKGEIFLHTNMLTIMVEKVEYTEVDLEEELKNISEKV